MSVGSFYKSSATGGMITIQASQDDVARFERFASLVPAAAAKAQRRAINKVLGWLRTHIARAVGKQERIAMRAVRQRLRSYPAKGSASQGRLWFGINPIEASRIGRPRQTSSGVSVAGRRYRGAFYRRVYGGQADIWIRTGSKHFEAEDYPASELSSSRGQRHGSMDSEMYGRFPLAKAKVLLEEVRPLFDEWVRRADQRLVEVLLQELNFELIKASRG